MALDAAAGKDRLDIARKGLELSADFASRVSGCVDTDVEPGGDESVHLHVA